MVDFEADVPGGNWVTVGFDSPRVRPVTCIGGTEKRALGATGMEVEMKQERSLISSTSTAAALQTIDVSNHRSFFVHKYFVTQLHVWLQCRPDFEVAKTGV